MVRAIGVLGPCTPRSGVNTSSWPSSVQVPSPATAMLSESSPSSIVERTESSRSSGTARRAECRSTWSSTSSVTSARSGIRVTVPGPGITERVCVWAGNSKGPSSPSADAAGASETASAAEARSAAARVSGRGPRARGGRGGGSSTGPA